MNFIPEPQVVLRAQQARTDGLRGVAIGVWVFALALGVFQAWTTRFSMNPDGIDYLDMGEAWFRGDWRMAINATWSPLYAWLVGLAEFIFKPTAYWEFPLVHLVNFVIYLFALVSFGFFLQRLLRWQKVSTHSAAMVPRLVLSEWMWLVLGYSVFIWTSVCLVTLWKSTPDMCVAAWVYLASGLILQIHAGDLRWRTFIFLGIILGLGYLTKAFLFPLGFIFLLMSLFAVKNLQKAIPRVLTALFIFSLLISPFIIVLSTLKGYFTYSDVGKTSYAWFVNGVTRPAHWRGDPPGSGTPSHSTRELMNQPALYEFGSPIGGTYPPSYDLTYWYQGIKPHFELNGQLKALEASARTYKDSTQDVLPGVLIVFFVLLCINYRHWQWAKDLAATWPFSIPAIIAIGAYAVLHVEARYVGPFIALLAIGLLSGVRLPDTRMSKHLLNVVTIVMIVSLSVAIVNSNSKELKKARPYSAFPQLEVVGSLERMEIRPGDKVASIGNSFNAFWARLARVQIVAEIPSADANDFWRADPLMKAQVIETFRKTGAKVLVADSFPGRVAFGGWEEIGSTGYYIYSLEK